MPRKIKIRPVRRQYIVKWQLITSRPDKTLELVEDEQFHEVKARNKDEAKALFLSDPPHIPEDCALVSNAYPKGDLPSTTYAQILEEVNRQLTELQQSAMAPSKRIQP